MARTCDLGWAMARSDGTYLELMEPISDNAPANSMRIDGRGALVDLVTCLQEAISDADERMEMEREAARLPGLPTGP